MSNPIAIDIVDLDPCLNWRYRGFFNHNTEHHPAPPPCPWCSGPPMARMLVDTSVDESRVYMGCKACDKVFEASIRPNDVFFCTAVGRGLVEEHSFTLRDDLKGAFNDIVQRGETYIEIEDLRRSQDDDEPDEVCGCEHQTLFDRGKRNTAILRAILKPGWNPERKCWATPPAPRTPALRPPNRTDYPLYARVCRASKDLHNVGLRMSFPQGPESDERLLRRINKARELIHEIECLLLSPVPPRPQPYVTDLVPPQTYSSGLLDARIADMKNTGDMIMEVVGNADADYWGAPRYGSRLSDILQGFTSDEATVEIMEGLTNIKEELDKLHFLYFTEGGSGLWEAYDSDTD